jgi:hypothetical protein
MKPVVLLSRSKGLVAGIAAAVLGAACVTAPAPVAAPPPPNTTVLFYPAQGQSTERQDRDKYECNGWAVQQSGFDPSVPSDPPHLQVQVAAAEPPGGGAVLGAASGAMLGAALSDPWESGEGALWGALAGALIGGISDAARLEQERAAADAATTNERAALLERMARDYRRAMSACLEGRGYTVR